MQRLFSPNNLPNVLLSITGIGGVGVALRTLRAIERQTRATEKSAEASLKCVLLQEVHLRQWVNTTDDWQAFCSTHVQTATEVVLTFRFGILNPTKQVLTIGRVAGYMGTAAQEVIQQHVLLPEEVLPVDFSTGVRGEEMKGIRRGDLHTHLSLTVEYIDAFGLQQSQDFEYTVTSSMTHISEIAPRGKLRGIS